MCKKLLVFSLTFCLSLISLQITERFKTDSIKNQQLVNLETTNSTQIDSNHSNLSDFGETFDAQTIVKANSRFGAAGIEDDKEVKDLYLKFQKAVAKDDRKTVASLMIYPLRVTFPTDKPDRNYTHIKNKKSFGNYPLTVG